MAIKVMNFGAAGFRQLVLARYRPGVLLLVLVSVFIAVFLIQARSSWPLTAAKLHHAGIGATHCGHVGLYRDGSNEWTCFLRSRDQGRSASVSFDVPGFEDHLAVGMVVGDDRSVVRIDFREGNFPVGLRLSEVHSSLCPWPSYQPSREVGGITVPMPIIRCEDSGGRPE